MASKTISRRSKAATLVPLALICAGWTASLASTGAAAAGTHADPSLPDGSVVPSRAIQAPASIPVPGAIAPTVPDGTADQVVASASASGIPTAALSAYQRGAQIIGAADTTCNIPWELLAAIGRVESNHGQYAGNTLGADGVSTPGIYGPELNGRNGTAAIHDTDAGELDGDSVYDRAVGPMQFIPSTWSAVKVDADGDGQRNPQDIDDASLAAAVYLCSGSEDLSTRSGQETAVYRYNHSHSYVNLVLRIMEAYSQGDYSAIPTGTYGGNVFSPSYSSAIKNSHLEAKKHPTVVKATPATRPGASTPPATAAAPADPGADPGTTPTAPATPDDPVTQGPTDLTNGVTEPLSGATQPVVKTLTTLTDALNFCNSQLGMVEDPTGLLDGLNQVCASRVQGMTETDAAAIIPNTLQMLLKWLGL